MKRRAGLLVAACVAVAPALGPLAATAAPSGSPTQVQVAPSPVPSPLAVVVTDLEPRVLQAGDVLTVTGSLATGDATGEGGGPSTEELTALRVSLLRGDRLSSRSALATQSAAGRREGAVVATQRLDDPVTPGGQVEFRVAVPVDELRLGALGVYPLTIEVTGRVAGGGREVLGAVQTYLPWFPEAIDAATQVAWLWPFVDVPHRGPDRLLRDDGLAAAFGADGRLSALLEAAIQAARRPTVAAGAPVPVPVPVTVVTDPDLLATARQMKGGYDVPAPDGSREPGGGQGAAEAWLARLTGFVGTGAQGGVLALPYADPDVSALSRGGLEDLVRTAVADGAAVVPEVLGQRPLSDLSWPPGGAVSPDGLATLSGAGIRTVVLDGSALPLADAAVRPATQSALAPAGTLGALTAVVADPGLSTVLAAVAADPAAFGGVRLAEQRFLAETALITAERPGARARTLLVAPPRRWAPGRVLAQNLLADTGRVPWLRPVTLAAVLAGPVSAERSDLVYPSAARAAELPADYVAGLRTASGDLAVVGSLLSGAGTDPARRSALLGPVTGALRAAGSSSWRPDQAGLAGGTALRRVTQRAANSLLDAVHVAQPNGPLTLTSSSGEIRIGLVNGLDAPVAVRLSLVAPARLRVTDPELGAVRVIPPGFTQVSIQVSSRAPGLVTLDARLLDRSGDAFGPKVPIRVRSTAYGRVAVAITSAAAGLLLLLVGVRIVRRALRTRAREAG